MMCRVGASAECPLRLLVARLGTCLHLKEREKIVHTSSTMAYSATEAEIVEKPRKLFPELPVTKCDGDKIEQHKDDFATTKRRLEEARARKMADVQKKKEIDK